MRDRERLHADVADLKAASGIEQFKLLDVRQLWLFLELVFSRPTPPGVMGGLGHIDRDLQLAGEHGEAADVVLMLVSDEDAVEPAPVLTGACHALECLFAGESSVDEDAGARAGDHGAVSPRSG